MLTAVGLVVIFFGYSRIERGLHFGTDRYGGIFDFRGMIGIGVLIAVLAWTPDRLWKALTGRRVP
jgi:hypothetical protein